MTSQTDNVVDTRNLRGIAKSTASYIYNNKTYQGKD